MSSRLKRWIIGGVGFLLVAIIVLVAITMLSGLSTTTVYNLRFVKSVKIEETVNPDEEVEGDETEGEQPEEGETPTDPSNPEGTQPEEPAEEYKYVELFEEDVFLTAQAENKFDVSVVYSASAPIDLSVSSSDPSVATIAANDNDGYTITYFKEGKATLRVYPTENPSIFDSFVLNVHENTPTSFKIITDTSVNRTALGEKSVYVFADDKDYVFKFDTTLNGTLKDINLSSIYVIKDYNEEIFDDVYIDDAASSLVIRAKQSILGSQEYITLQSRHGGENGEIVESFVIAVDVRGNYLINVQLCVDSSSDFKTIKNIYGSGIVKEGEEKIRRIILTSRINSVNFKVRVVYTNEDVLDVTDEAIINKFGPTEMELQKIERSFGNYHIITWNTSGEVTDTPSASIRVTAGGLTDMFAIEFYVDENSPRYQEFADLQLYTKERDEETNEEYYTYAYWDVRFMREDAIISPETGRIIGFANGNPSCSELPLPPAAAFLDGRRRTSCGED